VSDHEADYGKHTDEQLRAGIEKANENEARIAAEESSDALVAAQAQRQAMADELARRETGAAG